jgi:hypothetical protein
MTVTSIKYQYSNEAMWGNIERGSMDPDGYARAASYAKFEKLCRQALHKVYPKATIQMTSAGNVDKCEIYLDEESPNEHDRELEAVTHIINKVWRSFKWAVEK